MSALASAQLQTMTVTLAWREPNGQIIEFGDGGSPSAPVAPAASSSGSSSSSSSSDQGSQGFARDSSAIDLIA
jgi:hypothetical protein